MMKAETILFGYGATAPVKARIARSIGKSRSTVSNWAKDSGKIPLKDLRNIVRVLGLSDKEIIQIIRGK